MTKEKVSVSIKTGDHEDLYFKEQEQKKIKKLREQIKHESNKKYRDEHKKPLFSLWYREPGRNKLRVRKG